MRLDELLELPSKREAELVVTTTAIRVALAVIVPAAPAGRGEVTYVHAERVFIDAGRADGVSPGVLVDIRDHGTTIATIAIVVAAEHTSAGEIVNQKRTVRPGAVAVAREVTQPTAEPEPPPVQANPDVPPDAWIERARRGRERLVEYARTARPAALEPSLRTRAALGNHSWVAFDSFEDGSFVRQRLDLSVSGPLDDAGDWQADTDLSVGGQLIGPDQARFRPGRQVWIDVYRAAVAYRGLESLRVTVGRLRAPGLRWALVDGAALRLDVQEALRLELSAGLRPDTVSLAPELQRPMAALSASGRQALPFGALTYRLSGSWLVAEQSRTEGLESSLGLGLDVGSRIRLDGDAGVVLLVPKSGARNWVADRASANALVRFGETGAVTVGLRRLEDPRLGSEVDMLPAWALPGDVTYDAMLGVDGVLGELGPLQITGSASGGVTTDSQRSYTHAWASPAVTVRASRWRTARLRLAYRFEAGWVGAHLGELGVGLRLLDTLDLDVYQQAGALLLEDSQQVLHTASTWVRLGGRLGDHFTVGLGGRGDWLETSRGISVSVWLGLVDWL